jgi:integrase
MQAVTTIGLDIAKSVFQVHGVDAHGNVLVRRQLKRRHVLAFFEKLPPCLVGLEACASSHHWSRELQALGHMVRPMPPAYVKPYVKRQKNDATDAEAICEAVTRPNMRFVAIKTAEQQSVARFRGRPQSHIRRASQVGLYQRREGVARGRAGTAAHRLVLIECPCERAVIVRGALLTGCRYSELTAMRVSDFNADAGVVTVHESKAGKPRHVVLTDEGQRLFAAQTAGKLGNELIFRRRDGAQWGKSHQLRPIVEACRRAKIKPEISFHVLRHTHGSTLAMKGVPMGVIAEQLGHADTRMTEKHYAHLAPSYVAETIRRHFPMLGIAGETTVAPLRRNR